MNVLKKNLEFDLLLKLLRFELSREPLLKVEIKEQIESSDIDIDKFMSFAKFHKVHSFLYEAVKITNCLPAITVRLRELNARNCEKSLLRVSELKKLKGLFNKNNIDFTVIKGFPLSKQLYGNINQRSSKDIDILIKEADLEKVIKMFEKDYISVKPLDLPLQYIKPYLNELACQNSINGISIDIHWSLVFNKSMLCGVDNIPENTETITLSGCEFTTLIYPYNFIYCLIHGAMHAWNRLFWLRDAAEFCKRDGFNLEEILKISENIGITRLAASSLILSNMVFGVPEIKGRLLGYSKDKKIQGLIKTSFNKIISSRVPRYESPFYERITDIISLGRYTLLLKEGLKYKFQYIKNASIKYNNIRILPLPEKLFFLYIILSPVLIAIRWFEARYMNKR